MNFGALIIGDEILSGKREDKHLKALIAALKARGLQLAWCEYLGDDRALITNVLERTFRAEIPVFSFGGIGATPDDHTRACAARAAGVPLELHADAEKEIRARFGSEVTPQRLAMGEFPRGSAIIPNPYNRIPGFSMKRHYFLPGFPQMSWPMMEWVLDTHYKALFDPARVAESSIIVRDAGESQLITLMNDTLLRFPELKVFSLPRLEPDRHIELGARGKPTEVAAALAMMRAGVTALGFPWTAGPAPRAVA